MKFDKKEFNEINYEVLRIKILMFYLGNEKYS